jgi:hypothetical protein
MLLLVCVQIHGVLAPQRCLTRKRHTHAHTEKENMCTQIHAPKKKKYKKKTCTHTKKNIYKKKICPQKKNTHREKYTCKKIHTKRNMHLQKRNACKKNM